MLLLGGELFLRGGVGEPALFPFRRPGTVPGKGIQDREDRVDVEQVNRRNEEGGRAQHRSAHRAESVGHGHADDLLPDEAARAVEVGLALDELPAPKVLKLQQAAGAEKKKRQPKRLPAPLDVQAEKADEAADQKEKDQQVGGKTEEVVKQPGQHRADVTDEVRRNRIGRKNVKAEVGRVVRNERKQGNNVERSPETPDDLLDERQFADISRPERGARKSAARHGER